MARTPKEARKWRRSSAFSTTTRSTATRPNIRGTESRRSSATPTGRRRPRPRRSTSPRESCWARSRASSGCATSSRARAMSWSSPPTRTVPTRSSRRELPDAEVVISQPFWPAYMTAERIAKAPNLKLVVTAGIGSDHVDLEAAVEAGITVAEVTYSNSNQRLRARGDDDPRAGPQLHPLLPAGGRRRLEHRRLRLARVRPRGDAGRDRRRRADRERGAAALEAVRRRAPLHRPPSAAGRGRVGARRRPSTSRPPRMVPGLRRGDDQRAAASRDRAPLRRRDDRAG